MKYIEAEYTNEILDTGFIKKDALAKAMRRESKIEAGSTEKEIWEFNPESATGNDNPGISCEYMMEDM